MNDRQYKKQRERVKGLFTKWVELLRLTNWEIKVEYEREQTVSSNDNQEVIIFLCHADWRYCSVLITAYLPVIKTLDDDKLEYSVVHELMHVFLDEMKSEDREDHAEHVATILAKTIVSVHKLQLGSRNDTMI